MNNIEQKRKRIETAVKWIAVPAVGFVVAPFVYVAIKGVLGIAVAGVVVASLWTLRPWLASKFANWRLKLIKHEAQQNPIETLQNDFKARAIALDRFGESIGNFNAQIKTFEDRLDDFKKRYPDWADKFDGDLVTMRRLYEVRTEKYREAKANLKRYDDEIQKAKAIWEMAEGAAEMKKAAGVDSDDFESRLQVETALDSVQKSLNLAFSDLEVALLEQGEPEKVISIPKALPNATAVGPIEIEIPVERRKVGGV